MRCWRGYLFGARCKCDPVDATATPSSLASLKSNWFNLSGQVVLEKRPLSGCFSVCVCNVAAEDSAARTLNQFLASCNLSHLEDVLLANGFDELDFMVAGLSASLWNNLGPDSQTLS